MGFEINFGCDLFTGELARVPTNCCVLRTILHFIFRSPLDSFKLATKLLNLPGSGLGGDTSDTEVAGEKEKGTTSGDATSSPDCSESDILIPTASRDSRY